MSPSSLPTGEIHGSPPTVGMVGFVMEFEIKNRLNKAFDLSKAGTSIQCTFERPSGSEVTRAAVLSTDGKDGKFEYRTIAGDLTEPGTYVFQGHVTTTDLDFRTNKRTFTVQGNI